MRSVKAGIIFPNMPLPLEEEFGLLESAVDPGIDRRPLWSHLSQIASNISLPLLIFGDFNIIRCEEEKWGGVGPSRSDVEDFNRCIDDNSLSDLRSFGQPLSWNNKSLTGNLKLRRLDRALVNEEWLFNFPASFVTYLLSGLSDHAPIVARLFRPTPNLKKPFKFFSMWLEDQSLYPVVENAWKKEVDASPMDLTLRNAEHLLKDEYVKIANKEEQFYRQKSRNSWLNLGDSNTAYFHSAVKARFNKLSIQGSTYPDGSTTTNLDEVAHLMTAFFDNLLNNQNCSRITDPDQIPNPLRVLSQDEASSLTRELP
ncbi:uncharacterized protein LOC143891305 [Tasmannia lanceolata]|uniref:uncharacterized protein LOC143891305 n=1 Tax=Tasmannia lanceolata TaxID=3420 RepID=UPI004063D8E7